MKIAVVYDGFVRQVLEIEDLKDLPDNFTFFAFEAGGQEVTKQKNEVILLNVKTNVHVGDKYIPDKGLFRLLGA